MDSLIVKANGKRIVEVIVQLERVTGHPVNPRRVLQQVHYSEHLISPHTHHKRHSLIVIPTQTLIHLSNGVKLPITQESNLYEIDLIPKLSDSMERINSSSNCHHLHTWT
jgi:hypothetical protein